MVRMGWPVATYTPSIASRRTTVPAAGAVTLRVYDMRGRLVDSLLEGAWLPAGPQSIPYRTSLASGVYLYRLVAGGFSETKRMVLLK